MKEKMDMTSLLKWSLSLISETPSNIAPLCPERREHLEKAYQEAMGFYEDPNVLVRGAVNKISQNNASEEDIFSGLKVINECVEQDPEISRNLYKLGALECFLFLMKTSSSKEIALRCLEILSFSLQNNPQLQEDAKSLGLLDTLIFKIQEEPSAAAFGALAALIRHCEELEKLFSQNEHSCNIIMKGIKSDQKKVQIKAANFLNYLLTENLLSVDQVIAYDMMAACLDVLDQSCTFDEPDDLFFGEIFASLIGAILKKSSYYPENCFDQTPGEGIIAGSTLSSRGNSDKKLKQKHSEPRKYFLEKEVERAIKVLNGRLQKLSSMSDRDEEKHLLEQALETAKSI